MAPQLNLYRHDRGTRALITLAGEIDLVTAPLVREGLAECLRDGIRRIDVDLTAVTFCDASGLNAFLMASRLAADTGRTLRLHHPSQGMARVIEITGSGFLLHSFHAAGGRPSRIAVVPDGAPRRSRREQSPHGDGSTPSAMDA
ncbi:STAS domain-containing protein [Streptomyces sp. NPDC051315]|uniref:STAS domain-containing protein n=1 Tax=Streptomyces sp. NPDC051315 TaxID=3365650 RepID=UPI00378EBE9A